MEHNELSGSRINQDHLRLLLYGSLDPDQIPMSPEDLRAAYESCYPKLLMPAGRIIMMGTGGEIGNSKGFRKMWDTVEMPETPRRGFMHTPNILWKDNRHLMTSKFVVGSDPATGSGAVIEQDSGIIITIFDTHQPQISKLPHTRWTRFWSRFGFYKHYGGRGIFRIRGDQGQMFPPELKETEFTKKLFDFTDEQLKDKEQKNPAD